MIADVFLGGTADKLVLMRGMGVDIDADALEPRGQTHSMFQHYPNLHYYFDNMYIVAHVSRR